MLYSVSNFCSVIISETAKRLNDYLAFFCQEVAEYIPINSFTKDFLIVIYAKKNSFVGVYMDCYKVMV